VGLRAVSLYHAPLRRPGKRQEPARPVPTRAARPARRIACSNPGRFTSNASTIRKLVACFPGRTGPARPSSSRRSRRAQSARTRRGGSRRSRRPAMHLVIKDLSLSKTTGWLGFGVMEGRVPRSPASPQPWPARGHAGRPAPALAMWDPEPDPEGPSWLRVWRREGGPTPRCRRLTARRPRRGRGRPGGRRRRGHPPLATTCVATENPE
jgi:hypothetical protein